MRVEFEVSVNIKNIHLDDNCTTEYKGIVNGTTYDEDTSQWLYFMLTGKNSTREQYNNLMTAYSHMEKLNNKLHDNYKELDNTIDELNNCKGDLSDAHERIEELLTRLDEANITIAQLTKELKNEPDYKVCNDELIKEWTDFAKKEQSLRDVCGENLIKIGKKYGIIDHD